MRTPVRRGSIRSATSAEFAHYNPVLPQGVLGIATDTGTQKLGTGTTAWSALPEVGGSKPGALDKIRVLVIGSSNSAGQGASSSSTSWVGRLKTLYAATHEITSIGISGIAPSYWVTAASSGRTPLEDGIGTYKPHICIVAFTAQNGGGPSNDFVGHVLRARAICEMYGVRFLGVTPYISEAYTAAQRENNAWIGRVLKAQGLPLVDFETIWGPGPTIPDAIDSGDGLHVNDTGHLEQSRHITADMLGLSYQPIPRLKLPTTGGTTIPTGTAGVPMTLSGGWPQGSWTVAFRVRTPPSGSAKWSVSLMNLIGGSTNTRLRCPGANQLDVASTSGVTHSTPTTVAHDTEYHIALTYNAVTGQSVLYKDGAAVSTVTSPTGLTGWTGAAIGSTSSESGSTTTATGYQLGSLALYATVLTAADIADLIAGDAHTASLMYAAPLTDGTARVAGSYMAPAMMCSLRTVTNVTLP